MSIDYTHKVHQIGFASSCLEKWEFSAESWYNWDDTLIISVNVLPLKDHYPKNALGCRA